MWKKMYDGIWNMEDGEEEKMPDTRCQIPDGRILENWSDGMRKDRSRRTESERLGVMEKWNNACPFGGIGKSEVGDRRSEVRNQGSEIRGMRKYQKTEIGSQKSVKSNE